MHKSTKYTFPDILTIIGGIAHGQPDDGLQVRYLLTDSRQLIAPGQSLFFAIVTRKNNGHAFIPELLEKGVRLFVVSQMDQQWLVRYPDAGFIVVSATDEREIVGGDSLHLDPAIRALQRIAMHHRSMFQCPVIGITGSNGKTIVKEWLFQLLGSSQQVVRSPKSYNSQIGVPLSVWQMSAHDDLAIFEAGISTVGEMALLERIIHPTIGIITNIGPAHDAGFESRREKTMEKLRLFERAETLVVCSDHLDIVKGLESLARPLSMLFSWGREEGVDLRLEDVKRGSGTSELFVAYRPYGAEEGFRARFGFEIPFTDEASIENAMHCASVMLLLGHSPGVIAERMPRLQPVAMRLELKEGINRCSVIDDSYNADLSSLAIALEFLNTQTRHQHTTLIMSDILQTGLTPEQLYGEVALMVKAKKVGRLIGIGPSISSQFALFAQPAMFYPDTDTFLREFDFSVFEQEAILLKGARPFAFEKLSQRLQQKDHQTLLEVDLDALVHNLNVYRSHLHDGVRIMAMVKAFSYGSGSAEIAGLLQYHGVECLAVAYADEGKALRQGGIRIPIVVMNPEVRNFDTLFSYNLEPEIYSMELLERFAAGAAPPSGTEALSMHPLQAASSGPRNIHLKIDTGMHRLGFLPQELPAVVAFLAEKPFIRVASVFSQLAASDNPEHDEFTREQINTFLSCCNVLKRDLGYGFLRHICNSAAIGRFPEAHLDMVRPGIGLYGISNDPGLQRLLQHVSTFRSVISQIKHIRKGQTVGYNRAGVAIEDMTIAIVPVGYADGLDRRLGNGKGTLIVAGQRRPLAGNISMDMCALDVTGMDVHPGDEVIIFGKERSVQELARDMGTIPYEVLTSVSQRVKRVFVQG